MDIDVSVMLRLTPADAKEAYYRGTLEALIFRALAPYISAESPEILRLLDATPLAPPGIASGTRDVPDYSTAAPPVGVPVEKDRVRLQASGEAAYTGDLACSSDDLHAYLVESTEARASLINVDASAALMVCTQTPVCQLM
jgi:hypothetical protein